MTELFGLNFLHALRNAREWNELAAAAVHRPSSGQARLERPRQSPSFLAAAHKRERERVQSLKS